MARFRSFLLEFVVAVCTVVAFFCPWGFLCSFEGGQEAYRIIYPSAFVTAIVLGITARRLARTIKAS